MSQLFTLVWLKWRLFKNSLRSSKAAINRLASLIAMSLALGLALLLALGLAAAAYALTSPQGFLDSLARKGVTPASSTISAEFIFFGIFAFCYLVWATLPLSTGSGRQFDPGTLLMYPISLKKLFAVDFISEFTTLQAIFAIPAILGLGVGAGLGTGMMGLALFASAIAALFGLALTKWLSLSIGSLMRNKRTRGETLIAVIGATIGLGGALVGQVAPLILKYANSVKAMRWTPPGAAAYALSTGLKTDLFGYVLAVLALVGYTCFLVGVGYWMARRNALGIGGGKRKPRVDASIVKQETYTGWEIPLLSEGLSAVIEKEVRYLLRNAQVRMMAFMPLILIIIRFVNRRTFGGAAVTGHATMKTDFFSYASGLVITGGMLYVFMVLSGLICNQFAFEEGGMRTLILSPVERRKILIGKNIAMTLLAFCFSLVLLAINELIFRDLTMGSLIFAGFSFVIFAALMCVIGNWLSIRFPKRMPFGKRLNLSGVVGLMIIPMLMVLMLPPLGAVAAGYIAQSLAIEYVTLFVFAIIVVTFYVLVIDSQGESLQKREIEILEAVREPTDE